MQKAFLMGFMRVFLGIRETAINCHLSFLIRTVKYFNLCFAIFGGCVTLQELNGLVIDGKFRFLVIYGYFFK